MKRKERT